MARAGHKRIQSGTAVRGPYTRKHFLGTKRLEVEGFTFRDTYRTQCHELYDFIGKAPSIIIKEPMIDNVSNADTVKIPVATGNTAVAIFVMPTAGLITAASYGSNTAFTQSASNYFTITSNITRTSTTVLGTATHVNTTDTNALAINGGSNLVANTDYALTLSTATTRYVNAGDVVTFTATVTGTLAAVQDAPYITLTLQQADQSVSIKASAVVGQPLVTRVANTANGELLLQLDATSEAQTIAATFGDQLNFYKADVATPVIGDGPFVEFRLKVGATTTVSTNDTVVFGVATAFNATLTSISKYAWFRLNGNMNLVLESKDGTTTNTGIVPDPGTTALTGGTYYYFTIDMSDPTSLRFFYDDGKQDLPLTELVSVSMGALAATDILQPFIAVQKSTGTDNVDVIVDLVSIRWTRY